MNNLDHISESFKQFFAVRYLNSVMQNRDGKIRIRDGKNSDPGSGINISDPGSGINISDPQHCFLIL
jgi:hypothetical protein